MIFLRSRFRSAVCVLAVIAGLLAATVGRTLADPAKIAAGDAFPLVDAQSLTGTAVHLPADRQGRPFVAIFGFSRGSGDHIAQWSHTLHATLPSPVAVYGIADLSHVPGLFRGFAVSGIRKQASAEHPEHDQFVLLLTKANSWQDLVPAGAADDAVVVAVDAKGTVLEIERVPYSEVAAHRITALFDHDDASKPQ